MKYGDLIEFAPIDEIKEIRRADDPEQAREDVRTYVISDLMAERLVDVVFPALEFGRSAERKCLLIVATYGTGKTHLMSVIAAIAESADLVSDLTNPEVAKAAAKVAGQYKVIREELGTTTMSLRDAVFGWMERHLADMGVTYKFKPASEVANSKDSLAEMMAAFEAKYPEQGLLLVLDEMLEYLRLRRDTDLIYDLTFLRELGEFARGSRFQLVAGIQETLFDNPRFESAADAIRRVRDRYQQVQIARADVSFVVKNRLLRKTVAQRDQITNHLRPFTPGFEGMAEQFDEFVSLFPVHPAYLETFARLEVVEKRRILASLSSAMRKVMNQEVPTAAPGLICYDAYRAELSDDATNRTLEAVRLVLDKSETLRNRVTKALQPADDIPMALRIIDGLAIHRLTTDADIRAKIGPTPEELRDDLLLLPTGVPLDPLLLSESVQNVIEEIGRAVSWQFIHQDADSRQVYLAVDKDIDYDRKIDERAESLDDYDLDRAYFSALEQVLEQRDEPYVSSMRIWEYQLRWAIKRVTRRGYLFFGAPNERSTAKPPRDFYLYFLQPFAPPAFTDDEKPDEVFFRLDHPDDQFRAALKRYAGAVAMSRDTANAEHQRVYREKYNDALEQMSTWLRKNMATAMSVVYLGETMPLGERYAPLGQPWGPPKSVVDAVGVAALAQHFEDRYPGYPAFQLEITYGSNGSLSETVRQTIAGIVSGRPNQTAKRVLSSLELVDTRDTPIPGGTYAKWLRDKLVAANGLVVNRSELVTELDRDVFTWGPWNLEPAWLAVVAASLCQQGRLEIGFAGEPQIDATALRRLEQMDLADLEQLSFIAPPKATPFILLKAVLDLLGLPEAILPTGGVNEQVVKVLADNVASWRERVSQAVSHVRNGLEVWGQDVVDLKEERLGRIETFTRVIDDLTPRTSIGALNKVDLTMAEIGKAKAGVEEVAWVEQTKRGADALAPAITYLRSAQDVMGDGDPFKWNTDDLRRRVLAAFLDGRIENDEVASLRRDSDAAKSDYMDEAVRAHVRDRLDAGGDNRKREVVSGETFRSLETLAGVTLLPEDRLRMIREELARLIGCRDFDEGRDLVTSIVCPHCGYRPRPASGPTARARVDAVGEDVRLVRSEWERTLVEAVRDPETREKVEALDPTKRVIIDRLVADDRLPDVIDAAFVSAVNAALERFERRNATAADLWRSLFPSSSPATIEELRSRFETFLRQLAEGSDGRPVRVVPMEEKPE
jgi:hypothetical protein